MQDVAIHLAPMQRIPTTPNIGVEDRQHTKGPDGPSATKGKSISEKVDVKISRSGPLGTIRIEQENEPGSGPDHATPALLSEEDVREFQKLYAARFNKDISKEEAHEQGVNLLRLLELIYTPMTLDEHRQLQERRKDTGSS